MGGGGGEDPISAGNLGGITYLQETYMLGIPCLQET